MKTGDGSPTSCSNREKFAPQARKYAFFRIGPLEEVLIGSVGVGYTDNANLTPTAKVSDLSFKFAVSNVRVRLYDQFANVQNPTTDPTATDVANLNSFTNTGWRQIWVGSPPTLVRGVDLRLQSPRRGYVFEHLHSKFTFISSQLCVLTGTLDGNSPAIPSRR